MTHATFIDGDLSAGNRVDAEWLNAVNTAVYVALGAAGVAPTTAAEVIANLGLPGSLSLTPADVGISASLGNYANDAAAAGGGVAVGGLYRNGSVLMVRVA